MTAPVTQTATLAFDTSGPYCATAVFIGDQIAAARQEDMARGQAEHLMPLILDTLAEAGVTLQDLTLIAVGVGPGNFTGIRISVSAARGLALGLGIPATGVSLLEAVAFGTEGPVLAAHAAPRETAYIQGFGGAKPTVPTLITPEDPVDHLAQSGLICLGTAADALAPRIGARVAPAAYAPASAIGRVALTGPGAEPKPLYIRAADAAPPSDPPPVIVP